MWDDRVHEVAGCLLALDIEPVSAAAGAKLFQIDPGLQRAYLLHEHVHDIQWMPDSVLVVQEAFPATCAVSRSDPERLSRASADIPDNGPYRGSRLTSASAAPVPDRV